MHISKIELRNILGIDNLEFNAGKINIVSGKNGEGKTDSKGNVLYNTKKRMQWLQEEVDKIQQYLKQEAPTNSEETEVETTDEENKF